MEPSGAVAVGSAELVAALSLATDLGTGQPMEHALRTCVLATRLGELAGIGRAEGQVAFEVALLHSLGCTADAHEAAGLYGDAIGIRAAFATVDHTETAGRQGARRARVDGARGLRP
jgi:hypothetical protein